MSPPSTGRTTSPSPTASSRTPTRASPTPSSANTAINEGNSYEIYSNLGQGAYFEVPGGPTYFVNVAVADTGSATGNIYSVFAISGGQFTIPLDYTIAVSGSYGHRERVDLHGRRDGSPEPHRGRGRAHGRILHRPGDRTSPTPASSMEPVDHLRRLQQRLLPIPGDRDDQHIRGRRSGRYGREPRGRQRGDAGGVPVLNNQFIVGTPSPTPST